MRLLRNYWLPIALTLAAFGFGYARDAQDGAIGWGLLSLGTLIAAAGFFGGTYIATRVADYHDHR